MASFYVTKYAGETEFVFEIHQATNPRPSVSILTRDQNVHMVLNKTELKSLAQVCMSALDVIDPLMEWRAADDRRQE